MTKEAKKMARKGLPKKYAKMGFKKGWKAYKASKRGRRRSPTKRRAAPRRRRTYTAPKRRRKTMARRKKGRTGRKTVRMGTALTIGTVALPMAAPIIDEAMSGGSNYAGAAQQGLQNAAAAIPAALSIAVMTYVARFFIKGSIPIGRYNIAF